MAQIDGGRISFTADLNNEELNKAIKDSQARIQGFTEDVKRSGDNLNSAFIGQNIQKIRQRLGEIAGVMEGQDRQIQKLKGSYEALMTQWRQAGEIGQREEQAYIRQADALRGKIRAMEHTFKLSMELSNRLEEEASKYEEQITAMQQSATQTKSLRLRIRELREEMALLIDEGIDEQSEAYKKMADELARLLDIQGDINAQGTVLSNDEANYQGMIQGLSGLAGAFSATTGALSLFAGENEELQAVMAKVQSVMAISVGMQSVAQTLNKDSAFQLVTMRKLKEWWAGVVAKSTAVESANTSAVVANTSAEQARAVAVSQGATATAGATTAQTAQTAGAVAGATANWTLAGAFRAVGLAIKSIPFFGWIAVAVGAIATAIAPLISRMREAKKEAEAFTEALAEGAYKPIGAIMRLSEQYTELGDDLKAKEQFVEANAKAFEELGVKVSDVADAQRLLIDNKEAFINAQIEKAKSMIYLQQTTDKVKELIKLEQEYNAMSDTRSYYVPQGGFAGAVSGVRHTERNKEKEELGKRLEELNKEIKEGYKQADEAQAKSFEKLTQAGVKQAQEYGKGTVGAIEQQIQTLQGKLKDLVPNSTKWKETQKQIEALQKKLATPQQQAKDKAQEKDPYLEALQKRKAEYERFRRWATSGDSVLTATAEQEFGALLKQGQTYIDYLQRQRTELLKISEGDRTQAQARQLRTLNNQIAEEVKTSVLDHFNTELAEELGNARGVLEVLKIIDARRKAIGDDLTEIGLAKTDALNKAEEQERRQQREQTDRLLSEHEHYLDKKRKLEEEYHADMALLEIEQTRAEAEEERKRIQYAKESRTAKFRAENKGSGDAEYDKLLEQYKTFAQKMAEVDEEYQQRRATAMRHGNTELLAELEKWKKQQQSALTLENLKQSPDWAILFENFEEVATSELEKLLKLIEGQTAQLSLDLDPKDLEVVRDKIQALRDEIKSRNPFKAIGQSLKELKGAKTQGEAMKAVSSAMGGISEAGGQVTEAINEILSVLDTLGVEGTEEVGAVLEAVQNLASGAMDAVQGFLSGNPVQMITGVVKTIGSVVKYFAGLNDRRAERAIKRHQDNIRNLTSSYKQLEWQINKALATNAYQHQEASIRNLKQQQRELSGMIRAESGKKKKDGGKIAEWREQIQDINRSIIDIVDGMKQSLLGSEAKDIAQQLGDAIMGAFERGESAAQAWGATVRNVMNTLVKNLIVQKVLQEPIDRIIKRYTSRWVSADGVFKGYEVVARDVDNLNTELNGIYPQLERSINALKEKLQLNSTEGGDTTLTGAVKGVSEETASIVAGQLNAVRINQVEATSVLRQQLGALNQIAQNTAYNRTLLDIHKELRAIRSSGAMQGAGQGGDPLRAKGLALSGQ